MHHNRIHLTHTKTCHPFERNTICLHTGPEPVNWVSVLPPQRTTLSVSDQPLLEESCTLLHNMTSALSRASCQQLEDPSSWKTACKGFFVFFPPIVGMGRRIVLHNEISLNVVSYTPPFGCQISPPPPKHTHHPQPIFPYTYFFSFKS